MCSTRACPSTIYQSYHVHACMILSCHVCIAIPFPYMHPFLCMPSTHHWHEQHCSTFAIYLSHQHSSLSMLALPTSHRYIYTHL